MGQDPHVKVYMIGAFDDLVSLGAAYRSGVTSIANLTEASETTTRRAIDFISGMVYMQGGKLERVADRCFLLTPGPTLVSLPKKR